MGAEQSTVTERIREYDDDEWTSSRSHRFLSDYNDSEENDENVTESQDSSLGNTLLSYGLTAAVGLAVGASAVALFSHSQKQKNVEHSESTYVHYPQHWSTKSFKEHEDHFNLIPCQHFSNEYTKVLHMMLQTLPNIKIKSLQRIENKRLYENYAMKKLQMERKLNSDSLNEKQLFHGTTDQNVDSICYQGFDVRLSGERIGSRYGKGMYFAKDSKFSDDYAEANSSGHKKMFLAKVLVGQSVLGNGSYKRPPLIQNSFDLYDSCVNDIHHPSIYVIFDSAQLYPEYLIEYC